MIALTLALSIGLLDEALDMARQSEIGFPVAPPVNRERAASEAAAQAAGWDLLLDPEANEIASEYIREKIRAELPTLLKLYRADKFLVNKIVASATAFFEEVRNDPAHPFRGEFDRMVLTFVDRLGTDPVYAERIQGLKRDLLARAGITG